MAGSRAMTRESPDRPRAPGPGWPEKGGKDMRVVLAALVAALVFVAPLNASHAYENKVDLSIESGYGESSWEEVEKDAYAASYTRYFQALSDDGSPYGAREFLQRPSYAGVSIAQTRYKTAYTGAFSLSASEEEREEYSFSGMFYAGEGRGTGLGLSYRYLDGETRGAYSSTIRREQAIGLRIRQYLTDSLRIGFGYEKVDIKEPWRDHLEVYRVEASALIEKYWLSAWYRNEDARLEAMGAEFGLYPTRELGLFASYEASYKPMDYYSTLRFRGEYWLSGRAGLEVAYKWVYEDPGDFVADTALARLGLLF